MSYAAQTHRYLENDVLTRSPEWLVPLLYEHLLTSLRRAEIQILERDLVGKAESLGKASMIVGELLATLNREEGGEIAERLASLYSYFSLELLNIGRGSGVGSLPELTAFIGELHAAWVEAAEQIAPRSARNASGATVAA